MEEVRAHAQMFQDRGTRDAQNAEMLIQCLKASISRKVYNKVNLQKEKYTIIRKNTHEAVEDGVCFLKSIIDNYYSNTRSSTKQIRKQLAQLNYYMRNVAKGECFLKSIIDNYYSNTRSSTKQIRKQLAQLNYYMRNVAKGDVSKLCEHTRELIYELNAGETTNDLLANLIEALKEAPDVNFQRWLSNQVDLWSMRKLDWR
jgi:ribosomal protein L29